MQKQKRRLFVRGMTGQVFDRITPVLEPTGPVPAFDVCDCRFACNHTFQAGMIFFRRRTTHFRTPHES